MKLKSIQRQRGRIDAVAQAARFRAILEDMAKVGIAATAQNFNARHAMPDVLTSGDAVGLVRLPKARPAAARVEFNNCIEQGIAATHAAVNPRVVTIPIDAGERRFRATLAAYMVLLGGKFLAPVRI